MTLVEDDVSMTRADNDDETIIENKVINEEYKIWKKNAPFLYDMMLGNALEWPTLTTQWFPDKLSNPNENFSVHRLLIGTHTSAGAPNYLQIANVQLPNPVIPDFRNYDQSREEIGGYGESASGNQSVEIKFNVIQKIDHPGEVNKARYMPQNPDLIATMCTDGLTLIFDRTKHSLEPNGTVNPQITLKGHTEEGFGLCWSPHVEGQLVTGSQDSTVRFWDITRYISGQKTISPTSTYTHHTAIVNDVQYHPKFPFAVGTVADDLTVQILDTRVASHSQSKFQATGHEDAVNAIAFHPDLDFMFATGSADKTIGIWDMRQLRNKRHTLEGHHEAITSLAWNPKDTPVLASASDDRRIIFWDLSKIGSEQSIEDQEDGPPELMFMHGGHTNKISDFSWNLNDPWVVCSAAEDNLIQVWKVANAIVGKSPETVPQEEVEA